MWFEFFRFDLRYQLRQPLLWVVSLIYAAMAFGASTSDAVQVGGALGNIHRNAPVVVAQFLGAFSLLSMFVVTIFIAGAVLRDNEIGIADMIYATPMRKRDYLSGRFLGGLVACLAIFVLISVGLLLGPLMPWVDTERVGPTSLQPFMWGFGVFVIPNLLFIGALLMLLASTTRSMLQVYVGIIAFFVLWGMAGTFTSDINNEWIASMLDPFGIRAFARMTRYFSVAESNSMLPPLTGFLLVNRIVWAIVALAMFAATLILFKPQRAGTGRRLFGKGKQAVEATPVRSTVKLPQATIRLDGSSAWRQCWSSLYFDAKAVFRGVAFLVMLLFGISNFLGSMAQGNPLFGTTVYPVTRVALQMLNGTFNFMLIIILTFYAGELIFKERQSKIAEVTDAMPVPNWVPLVSKCLALCGVILGFLVAGVAAAICFQLYKGGVQIEWGLYIKGVLLESLPYVLMGMMAIVLQVLSNNKFIGYLLMIVLMIAQMMMNPLHLEHNLYNYAGLPRLTYSDMNGYGHFLTGWSWFALYWSLCALALLLVAQAFWVRGLSQDWRSRVHLAAQRLHGAPKAALMATVAAFVCSGVWIFYNTNVLNHYVPSDVAMDHRADYEKKYRQYKDLPQPRVTDVQANVDIFPAERRVAIKGHYVLQNKSSATQQTLYIQTNPDVETHWLNMPAHQELVADKEQGFYVFKLAQPVEPGAQLPLDFTVDVTHHGFTNDGKADHVNLNGTFFLNADYFPGFGYSEGEQLNDRNERRKRSLGEPQRMAKLEDMAARNEPDIGNDSDWINFDTTVSTSSDQIAISSGYLQDSWEKDGRRYFHYKMDKPIVNYVPYLSARWQIRKGEWQGIPIEIYYDEKHAYNVDRMISATQKSLDYYTHEFSPYQHKQVRILEFPAYAQYAQSLPNTIPYSESIGFIADLRDPDDIDYVYYVTAHEVAHQWWGHQEVAANLQGSTMLIESLAQYSALMVMEKEYGRAKMRRFLRHELDGYLRARGGEKIEEMPLYRVENQQYIHYRKGSLVFYRLRDEIGEEALKRALKNFVNAYAFKSAPYPTSLDLLKFIRAETPADKQALVTDLFEKIVFYDNRVTEATAKQRADGQWDVTMKLHLAKLEADGKGKETPRAFDEPVELAVFARAPGAKEKDERVLFDEKRLLQGSDPTVTVTVKEKPFETGVDPYNILIDRVPTDNRKEVTMQ